MATLLSVVLQIVRSEAASAHAYDTDFFYLVSCSWISIENVSKL